MPFAKPSQAHTYLEAHFQKHLARTQSFLRQPSISAQNIGVRQCADILHSWLGEQGPYVKYHGSEILSFMQNGRLVLRGRSSFMACMMSNR